MAKMENVVLKRDVDAVQIPYGAKMKLTQGMRVTITQSLGGSYTVLTDVGYMVRIAGNDADALGKEAHTGLSAATVPAGTDTSVKAVEKKVWEELRTCYDPEIPINIVDLGLVYLCKLEEGEKGHKVLVRFTLTAPGCGMGDILKRDIEAKIMGVPGVLKAEVEVVFEPQWDRTMMSDAAKLQLGMY